MTRAMELVAWIWANTERLRDLAVLLSAIAALIGAPVAYLRIRAYRLARQELIAKDLYKSYIMLAVDHPDLAYPATRTIDYPKCQFDASREKFEKYEWFISYLLMTASEILNLETEGKNWRGLMRVQIWYHKRYFDTFQDDTKMYLKHQPANVRALIEEVRKDTRLPT